MDNKFDSSNYPTVEPTSATAGERWAWKRPDITDAYPTATYTLSYTLIDQVETPNPITITAAKTASEHVVEVGIATTADYPAADYEWLALITRDSDDEQVVVDRGFITVRAATGDTRSHTYIVLMKIRAVIEGTASKDDQSYSIANRSLSRRSLQELVTLERQYTTRWEQEQAQADREAGRAGKNRRVFVKMSA